MTRALLILTAEDVRRKAADWCRRLPYGTRVRPIMIEGDVAFVPLTKGYVAIIDSADVHMVDGVSWCAITARKRNAVYAFRAKTVHGRPTSVLMHRLIMNPPDGVYVDHIDGDGLNNRRSNLRLCTFAQNVRNQGARKDSASGIRGVSWDKKAAKWKAEIWLDGRNKFLGYFDSIDLATAARNEASIRYFGEFARIE